MDPIKAAEEKARNNGFDLSKLPKNTDMNAESITANVHAMNIDCKDDRAKFVLTSLINHLHAFVRETALTNDEWLTAINFLTQTGQMCTDIRQEFILLSDTLGVTMLVDSINNAKPAGATESTVLGPFFAEDRHDVALGDSIASEGKGDYLFVEGRVLDTEGNPIPHAMIDTWETDGHGQYDTQYENRTEPDCRGRLYTADDGSYSFRAVVPVSYPIPDDGTVGKMMNVLGRHVYRPAHLHVQISAAGFEGLTTSLFFEGDPYLSSDAVFGVKTSLITGVNIIDDVKVTQARGFRDPKPHAYLKRDFVLATPEQCVEARRKLMQKLVQ
ncbi:intradiol ring-cleavage dioxygenase [Pholiota conissans]|uniref:Intradiol ring-cleavage dioxygenase n=1 Tax=Pholiota conissans TaxID=109636 RepID=A0A9P6D0Z6_9AGAR|nr:intradiol ring-cleavage dioxygenase [Pholiota conissans]